MSGGYIERLSPGERCYALMWPDGIVQLELRPAGAEEEGGEEATAAQSALLQYLSMRLAGDGRAMQLLMRPQETPAPELDGYEAVVPLRFAPLCAGELFDERAGLVRRVLQNAAVVDVMLAVTVPAGQGRRMIERVKLIRT